MCYTRSLRFCPGLASARQAITSFSLIVKFSGCEKFITANIRKTRHKTSPKFYPHIHTYGRTYIFVMNLLTLWNHFTQIIQKLYAIVGKRFALLQIEVVYPQRLLVLIRSDKLGRTLFAFTNAERLKIPRTTGSVRTFTAFCATIC